MRRGLHVGLLLALLLAATSPTPLAKGGADDGVEYLIRIAPGELASVLATHRLRLDPTSRRERDLYVVYDDDVRPEVEIETEVRGDIAGRWLRAQPSARVWRRRHRISH